MSQSLLPSAFGCAPAIWITVSGISRSEEAKIGVIHTFQGLEKVEVTEAAAGEIVSVTGIEDFVIGTTYAWNTGVATLRPSTAESTEIAGVIMPSP